MGIEQHFVALTRVGHEPERTTGAQLEVRYLHAPVDAPDHQPLFAPVELKRFAQFKLKGHEGLRRLAFAPPPIADESGQLAVAARVALRPDLRKQRLRSTPVLFGTVGIGFERLFQRGVKRAKFAGPSCLRYVGGAAFSELLSHLRIVLRDKPVSFVISCSDNPSRKYIRRILPNISMVITSLSPAQELGRTSRTPGSIFDRHNPYKWVSFRSAATPISTF